MKKLWILLAWAAIAAACSNEAELPSPQPSEDEMVEVSFNLGGDYVSVEETPMTRAESWRTLYRVEVIEVRVGTDISDRFNPKPVYEYFPYANGILDDENKLSVNLERGKSYNFHVCVVKEKGDAKDWEITNIIKRDTEWMQASIQDKIFEKIEPYVGDLEMAVENNDDITIELERRAISITYNIEPPLYGEVRVMSEGQELITVKPNEEAKKGSKFIYAQLDQATPRIFKFVWDRGDGIEPIEIEKVITLTRGKNIIINADLNNADAAEENGIKINLNDQEAYEDEVHNIQ